MKKLLKIFTYPVLSLIIVLTIVGAVQAASGYVDQTDKWGLGHQHRLDQF